MARIDYFGSLPKECTLHSGFEGVERLATQEVKEITHPVEVQPYIDTRGKLLLWVSEHVAGMQ